MEDVAMYKHYDGYIHGVLSENGFENLKQVTFLMDNNPEESGLKMTAYLARKLT